MIRYTIALLILLLAAVAQADAHADWCRAALAKVPVSRHDRGNDARMARRAQQQAEFATQIARFSRNAPLPPRQWAALLVTLGLESHFDSEVVDGRCRPSDCDAHNVNGVIVFRAVGAYQQQLVPYVRDLWPTAAGNIPAQVEMADRSLRRSLSRCKAFAPWPAHVFRAYGGGSCSWPVAREAERVAMFAKVVAR